MLLKLLKFVRSLKTEEQQKLKSKSWQAYLDLEPERMTFTVALPTPNCLSTSMFLSIHARQIERFGGTLGVRDEGLFESAFAQVQATLVVIFCIQRLANKLPPISIT